MDTVVDTVVGSVVVASFDQNIYVWDTPWTFDAADTPWPMFKKNQRNSGVLDEASFTVVGVGDGPPGFLPVLRQNRPNPAAQLTPGSASRSFSHSRLLCYGPPQASSAPKVSAPRNRVARANPPPGSASSSKRRFRSSCSSQPLLPVHRSRSDTKAQ